MKARWIFLLIGIGILVSVGTVSFAQEEERGLGERPPTYGEQAYIDEVYSHVQSVAPNILSRVRAQQEAKAAGLSAAAAAEALVPAAVDNSTLPYFPPIRSQGSQGSCTAWAAGYYYNTYTQAKDEGYIVSGGDNTRICSPAFLYPLMNGGNDNGASSQYTVARLNEIGCCSWALKPYSSSDFTSWPSEAAWVNALQNRTQTALYINGSTQTGVNAIKQHLANGNIAVSSFIVYRTWYSNYPAAATGYNNDVYYCPDGASVGGHAITLVGYDDSKSYVDHRDGQTHSGAFLVANSWGPNWGVANSTGSKGFFWVAYSMFLERTFGPTVYFNSDRPQYRPLLYAVAGVNHLQRGYIALQGIIGSDPGWVSDFAISYDGGTATAISDANRVAIDLTDGVDDLVSFSSLTAAVAFDVASAVTPSGTMTSADFYQDFDEDGNYTRISSTDPVITVMPGSSGYATAVLSGGPTPTIPTAPSLLTATAASQTRITLAWQDNASNETGFVIERKLGAAGTYSEIASVATNTTSWVDTGVAADNTYYYKVKAYASGAGSSGYSNEASATTPAAPSLAPSDLTASIVASRQIRLTWRDNSSNESNFYVERKTGVNGTYNRIGTLKANTISWTSSIPSNNTYYYRVCAYTSGVGKLDYSNEASVVHSSPAAPSTLTAIVSGNQVTLSWTDNSSNETGFKIERKSSSSTSYRQIATTQANAASWSDTITSGTTYSYRVRAYATYIGNSSYSNVATITIPSAAKIERERKE